MVVVLHKFFNHIGSENIALIYWSLWLRAGAHTEFLQFGTRDQYGFRVKICEVR